MLQFNFKSCKGLTSRRRESTGGEPLLKAPIYMRGLGQFRNSEQAFAQGVKIPRTFAFVAVRHMTIGGKIVDYISGHKQFDVASAISNFKKFSLKIFLRSEQLKQNQRTFGSVDGDFIKSNRTKNTSKMLHYLLGLIFYSNTIFGNISGKNKVISRSTARSNACHGAQDDFFPRFIFACTHAGYLVIFTETGK